MLYPICSALLGYSSELQYGDAAVKEQTWSAWAKNMTTAAAVGATVYGPSFLAGLVKPLIPQSGQGPSREDMERGFLKLHAIANLKDKETHKNRQLKALFEFRKDTGYLYTAALLCETGLLLLEKYGSLEGGCLTPASALGSDLTERILNHMDTFLEIKEVQDA